MEDHLIEQTPLKVLCIEDSSKDAEIIRELLTDAGFDLHFEWVKTAEELLAALQANRYDVILSDFGLPGYNAYAALRMAQEHCPGIPFICVSGSIGEETAIDLIKMGAVDYILKDRLVRLPSAIHRALYEVKAMKLRQKMEEALRESENRFRLLFECSMDAVLLTSPSGEIFSANPAACAMFGLTEEQLCAVGRNGIFDVNDLHTASVLEERSRTGKFIGELTLRRNNGSTFPAEISSSIFKDQYNRERTSMIIRDITERKQSEENLRRIEEQLRQSEKMDAIGQLAGGIAHDFNNVLGGIIGYTEMSLAFVEHDSIVGNNLRKVLQASERAANLVKQILTFSRRANPQKSVTSIKPILKEVLELLRATIPSSVIIESRLDTDTKPVLADSTKIHEAILNLATNAVDAMNRKGILSISLSAVILDYVEHGRSGDILPGEYTVIEIGDTGCGMDATTLSRAFEPFFTTKAVGEGTGMGLSVVLGVVQSFGGDLIVETEIGKGTTIRLYLPGTNELLSHANEYETESVAGGNEHILFVDDEPMLVEMNVEWLNTLGYTVTGLSNGAEALQYLRQYAYTIDVLITDQTMPGMSGSELIGEALKIRNNLPVILCTGYNRDIGYDDTGASGNKKIIMKPYRSHQIGKIIREALDRK
jgi:PAS domain S-box-containing protein